MSLDLSSQELRAQAAQTMRNGLSADLHLTGRHVVLEPMQLSHVEQLGAAAADGELWKLRFTSVPDPEAMDEYLSRAIMERDNGNFLPFVVRRLSDDKIVGTTSYYRISTTNLNLSIGYTWYSASVHRTAINTECKYLLLNHAFEVLGCNAVMWHTHHDNVRSQAAIKRIGAKFDGVLRADQILADGSIRDTYCYSMLRTEWPDSKAFLANRLGDGDLS